MAALRKAAVAVMLATVLASNVIAQDSGDESTQASPTYWQQVAMKGFLNNGWRDAIGIIGVLGVGATLLSLLYAVHSIRLAKEQLERTTNAATAATNAAIKAHRENAQVYNRYVVANMVQLLEAAKDYVTSEQWALVTLRLGDLARLAGQLELKEICEELRQMESTFRRISKGEVSFNRSMGPKWNSLQLKVSNLLDALHTPKISNNSESEQ